MSNETNKLDDKGPIGGFKVKTKDSNNNYVYLQWDSANSVCKWTSTQASGEDFTNEWQSGELHLAKKSNENKVFLSSAKQDWCKIGKGDGTFNLRIDGTNYVQRGDNGSEVTLGTTAAALEQG